MLFLKKLNKFRVYFYQMQFNFHSNLNLILYLNYLVFKHSLNSSLFLFSMKRKSHSSRVESSHNILFKNFLILYSRKNFPRFFVWVLEIHSQDQRIKFKKNYYLKYFSKRKIEDFISLLNGFNAVVDMLDNLKSAFLNFK